MTARRPPSHGPRETWDVFLAYAEADRAPVERIHVWLEDTGVRSFFDRWDLMPGGCAQEAIELALATSRCCAVFIGPAGLGPWQTGETRVALQLAADSNGLRVIPVLLPGASLDAAPAFLRTRTACPIADGADYRESMEKLRAAILNKPREPPPMFPEWLAVVPGGGRLKEPTGVAVEGNRVFVADHEADRIIRVGVEPFAEVGGLSRPHHLIAVDDRVIVCDTDAHRVVAYTLDLECQWPRASARGRTFRRPHGLCWTSRYGLLVLNTDRHRLERVAIPEKPKPLPPHLDDYELSTPCGIGGSPRALFIADTFNHRIVVLDHDLRQVHEFGEHGYGDGQFANPVGVACSRDYVVVADEHNQRLQIWKVAPSKQGRWRAKLVTADACGSYLGSPFGVAFDRFGDTLYVTDRKRGRVLQVDFAALLGDRQYSRRVSH